MKKKLPEKKAKEPSAGQRIAKSLRTPDLNWGIGRAVENAPAHF